VLRDNLKRLYVDEGGLGRRGTTVDAEHILGFRIVCTPT
jgi:hypothetical protein